METNPNARECMLLSSILSTIPHAPKRARGLFVLRMDTSKILDLRRCDVERCVCACVFVFVCKVLDRSIPHALQYALVTGTLRTRATASPALRRESKSSVPPTRNVKTVAA